MTDMQPKKMIILDILEILREHTDENNPLSQKKIQEILEAQYGMKVDRKTVSRNLSMLEKWRYPDFPVKYRGSECKSDAITRNGKNGEETILTDWYYVHEFTNGEIRLLIDSVLFADGLSQGERESLIKRLEKMSSKYFHSEISKIDTDIYGVPVNMEVILTLENIGEAISEGRQLSFNYCDRRTDAKLYPRLGNDGEPKEYIVNPYQIIRINGHSYLICNLPQYDDLTHFRIDRIKGSKKLDTPSRHLRMIKGFEMGIRLSDYVKAHPNMWGGTPVHITFRCKKYMLNDVVDSFGTDLRIEELPDEMMKVHIHASEASMVHWAIQFADAAEVLSPQSLREQIAETLRSALRKYDV